MTIFMYAAAADMHCGDLKIRGNEMNTLISYVYRDDGNWKTYNDPNVSGRMVQDALDANGITLNKNCAQNEKRSPMQTSGVRIGTAAMTSKGWEKENFIAVAHKIDEVIRGLST